MPQCALCRAEDAQENLIAPCRCKGTSPDGHGVHVHCIEKLSENHESDEPLRCSQCHHVYKVSIQYRFVFAWTKFLSCRSLAHMVELVVVVLMVLCGGFTLYLFNHSPEISHTSNGNLCFIYFLCFLTMAMVPLTFKKVFDRWKRANAVSEVVDIV